MELSAFGELHIHWAESCISGYLLLILSNLILSEFSSEFFPLSCETLMYLDGCASSPLQQMDNMHNKEPCMISAGFPRFNFPYSKIPFSISKNTQIFRILRYLVCQFAVLVIVPYGEAKI